MAEIKFADLIPTPDKLLDKKGHLADYAAVIDWLVDTYPKTNMELMRRQVNPWTCDARFLKPMAMSVGIEYNDELSTAIKRRITGNAANLFKLRGSVYPLIFLAYQFLDYKISAEIVNRVSFGISNFSRSWNLLTEFPFEPFTLLDADNGVRYHLKEGTGTTVDNLQGDAAYDMALDDADMWDTTNVKFPRQLCYAIANNGTVPNRHGVIADGANSNFDGEDNFTARIWFRANDAGQQGEGRFLQKANGIAIYFDNTDEIGFKLKTAGGYVELITTTSPMANEWEKWHLLICTYDGTTKTIYFDGRAIASTTDQPGSITDPAAVLNVLDTVAYARAFDGQIGCLALDHYCMGADEVAEYWKPSIFTGTLGESYDLSVMLHDQSLQPRHLQVSIGDWDGDDDKVRFLEYLIEEWTNARRGRYMIETIMPTPI